MQMLLIYLFAILALPSKKTNGPPSMANSGRVYKLQFISWQ